MNGSRSGEMGECRFHADVIAPANVLVDVLVEDGPCVKLWVLGGL